MKPTITIIGGGPAGLFCAFTLLEQGYGVDLYDQMTGVGKKFLVAGNGGLNLTHSEDITLFCKKYGEHEELFGSLLNNFSPTDLRTWCERLGVKTFIGSSGRIFPEGLTAAEILSKWVKALKSNPEFHLFLEHRLINISKDKLLEFSYNEQQVEVQASIVILALGGASWEKTGSDGKWKGLLEHIGIEVESFLPMNCGFERSWSDFFISKIEYTPLKNIKLQVQKYSVRGEIMLTPFGIEGGAVYALSNHIRNSILKNGKALVCLDLKPDLSLESIIIKIKEKKKKESLGNFLRKSFNFDKITTALMYELSDKEQLQHTNYLAGQIKALELDLVSPRPLSEAISTSGGVRFKGLTSGLEVKEISGLYIAGEMLDFEAPTGGYLLQGCFSTAWRVVESINKNSK